MTDEDPRESVSEDRVTVRRAPKYGRFLILGAGAGVIAAYVGTALFPVDPDVGFAGTFGFFLVIAAPAGVALGALIAIGFDAIASRRAKQYSAERTTVDGTTDTDPQGELE